MTSSSLRRIAWTASAGIASALLGACDVERDERPDLGDGPELSYDGGPEPEPPALPEAPTPPVEPLTCGDVTIAVDDGAAEVVLVLDKSQSMIDNRWDHDLDPSTPEITRWASLHQVVEGLVADFDDRLRLGAVLFPAVDVIAATPEEACRVSPAPDASVAEFGGDAVMDALPHADARDLRGGTPATAGLEVAIDHLLTRDAGRPRAIILVTDGAANCAAEAEGNDLYRLYDEALAERAAEAAALGIPVYVVGIDIQDAMLEIPRANPYERLGAVATAGGVPRPGPEPFYNTTDENQLFDAITDIAASLGCTVDLGLAGPYRGVDLQVGDTPLEQGACEDGGDWTFQGEDGDRVQLCPSACQSMRVEGSLHARAACYPEP